MEPRNCPVCFQNSEFRNFAYHTNPNIPSEKIGLFSNLRVAVCATCGTGQASPACSSEELRDFYRSLFTNSSTKSGLFKKGLYARTAHQFLTFKDFININKSSIIEIGSNDTGWFKLCKMYRAKSYAYFDAISSSYIDKRGGRFLGFLNANSLSAVESSSIDLVVASHSLEHLIPEEIRELLNSINRILKPQTGKLFIEIPLELECFDSPTLTPPHTLFFTQNGLINLLENFDYNLLGLQVIRGHKYKTYKREENLMKQILHYVLMKVLLPEKIFPDSIVQLSSRFNPPSQFDYLRLLVQRR